MLGGGYSTNSSSHLLSSSVPLVTETLSPASMVGNLIDLEETSSGPAITPNDFDCVVLYDFQMEENDRLDVKRGTVLRVSQDEDYLDPDWWYATTIDDFRSGWVPINYCKKL